MVKAENFVGKVPEYKSQYTNCPEDKRYFNDKQCEKCELPKYWDFDNSQCKECDKDMQFYKGSMQCVYKQGQQSFKTNLDATKNVYYNGDFEQVKK